MFVSLCEVLSGKDPGLVRSENGLVDHDVACAFMPVRAGEATA